MRYYVRGSEGVGRKTKIVRDKTKELKIPILLSAFYSTHVNLLTFTLPRLYLSHVTCSSHHTYF